MPWRNPGKASQNQGLTQEACSRELPLASTFSIPKKQKSRKPFLVKGTEQSPWMLGSPGPSAQVAGVYDMTPGVSGHRGDGAQPAPPLRGHQGITWYQPQGGH